ncbi:WD40 repeat domain-containing protein [Actinosynnema mirum]|uniref:WD40 repeat domain-containing protein n=1 Tax=Actinosynnema mirum TaxID=40567 RepID=UPI00117F54FC|nr:hypothetical protein [Actinosynnema mirum]
MAVPFAGRTLLACGDDRDVRLWDPAGEGAALTGVGRVEAAVPLPDGRVLLACAAPGLREVRLVDAVTGEVVASCGELVADLLAVAAAPLPDGRALLVTGDGDALRAWDPVGPGPVVHAEDVVRVAPLPERGLLAVGHRDGTVLLRDARTGEQVGAPLSAEVGETLWSMVVVPASEGRVLLAAKAGDVAVELLDVDTGLRAPAPALGGGPRGEVVGPGERPRAALPRAAVLARPGRADRGRRGAAGGGHARADRRAGAALTAPTAHRADGAQPCPGATTPCS